LDDGDRFPAHVVMRKGVKGGTCSQDCKGMTTKKPNVKGGLKEKNRLVASDSDTQGCGVVHQGRKYLLSMAVRREEGKGASGRTR